MRTFGQRTARPAHDCHIPAKDYEAEGEKSDTLRAVPAQPTGAMSPRRIR